MKQKVRLQQKGKSNKGFQCYLFLLFFLCTGCCTGKGTNRTDYLINTKDTIEVVYYPGFFDTSIGFQCYNLKYFSFQQADTVFVNGDEFDEIVSCFNHFDRFKEHCDCDARYYVTYGHKDIFLSGIPLYTCDGRRTPFLNNDHALYLLLDKCQFYNHIPFEELFWFELIKKYGVPNDYYFIQPNGLQEDSTFPSNSIQDGVSFHKRSINSNHGFKKTVMIRYPVIHGDGDFDTNTCKQ